MLRSIINISASGLASIVSKIDLIRVTNANVWNSYACAVTSL